MISTRITWYVLVAMNKAISQSHALDSDDWQPEINVCSRCTQALLCCVFCSRMFWDAFCYTTAVSWRVLPPAFLLGEVWSCQAGCLGCCLLCRWNSCLSFNTYLLFPSLSATLTLLTGMFIIGKALLHKMTAGKVRRHLNKSLLLFQVGQQEVGQSCSF